MNYLQPIDLAIVEKLERDEAYRRAFFRADATDSICNCAFCESYGTLSPTLSAMIGAVYASPTHVTFVAVEGGTKVEL